MPEQAYRDGPAWEAGVLHEDPLMRDIVIQVGRRIGDGYELISAIGGLGKATVHQITQGEAPPDDAVLRLPASVARALADALTRHFGGTSDSRTLRRDYDAERARVDKLTDALIGRLV